MPAINLTFIVQLPIFYFVITQWNKLHWGIRIECTARLRMELQIQAGIVHRIRDIQGCNVNSVYMLLSVYVFYIHPAIFISPEDTTCLLRFFVYTHKHTTSHTRCFTPPSLRYTKTFSRIVFLLMPILTVFWIVIDKAIGKWHAIPSVHGSCL